VFPKDLYDNLLLERLMKAGLCDILGYLRFQKLCMNISFGLTCENPYIASVINV